MRYMLMFKTVDDAEPALADARLHDLDATLAVGRHVVEAVDDEVRRRLRRDVDVSRLREHVAAAGARIVVISGPHAQTHGVGVALHADEQRLVAAARPGDVFALYLYLPDEDQRALRTVRIDVP